MKKLLALAAVVVSGIAAVPALAASHTVKVADNKFGPKTLTVKKGTKVRFKFVGDSMHNVTRVRGPKFKTISNRDHGTITRTLKRRGTLKIVCTIHPGMDLKIKVK